MKTSKLAKVAALLLILAVAATGVFADSPKAQKEETYKYVFVTGSMIPQRVKVTAIGTTTASRLRVYKRSEIDQTGRFTTADVLALDPSLRVISGHSSGGK